MLVSIRHNFFALLFLIPLSVFSDESRCKNGYEEGMPCGNRYNHEREESGIDAAAIYNIVNSLPNIENERNKTRQAQYEQQLHNERRRRIENMEEAERFAENFNTSNSDQSWRDRARKASSGNGGANLTKERQGKEPDTTQGCPFLVVTQFGLTHRPNVHICHDSKTLVCSQMTKKEGKLYYSWYKSFDYCSSGTRQAKEIELNSTTALRFSEDNP